MDVVEARRVLQHTQELLPVGALLDSMCESGWVDEICWIAALPAESRGMLALLSILTLQARK